MAWERKVSRTLQLRNEQAIGQLAKILHLISDNGGNIGDIRMITETSQHVVRDITIYADTVEQFEIILEKLEELEGTVITEVRDEVLQLHLKGKIAVRSRYPIDSMTTLRRVYTPGVAEVCMLIAKDPSLARLYTCTSHMIAIVTDGTAVLGLGDIGPLAGMPVMEGKAMLMESLVGLSGFPILLNTKDPDRIVDTIAAIAPTFAAIQLEDISAPRCFEIEERLKKILDIPVMHDDQHGTAVVTTAALLVATRRSGVSLSDLKIGQIGLGAAGLATTRMLMGITSHPVWGADLNPDAIARFKSYGGNPSTLTEIMANCDVVISTTGVQGLIKPEMVRKGQIILALSNPKPEIEPEVALANGAIFAADGKSVNNVLGFPGIFRGAVDSNASTITNEMLIAAAYTIAELTKPGELVPNALDKKVHLAVAKAVALKAFEQGVARADYVAYIEE
jgi:malate dehydrogenase (oxaloacetate-decarboxylating)